MQLTWIKSFELETAKLDSVRTDGVYVVYQTGNPPRTISVGKGDVAKRLSQIKADKRFEKAGNSAKLLVTYAAVPPTDQEGVEKYLARLLAPQVEERRPDVREIAVNSPFAA
jgi:hypothetical protein